MSHISKVVSLAAALLVFVGGVSVAAPPDPTKQISPYQGQAIPKVAAKLPDPVPWKGGMGGGIGVKGFSCSNTQSGCVLQITLGIRNSGTAKTTVAVKTLTKVNGQQWVPWDPTQNPHTTAAEMWPNQWQEFHMNGPVPGPGTYTLEVKVDSENAQLEKNENNNVATATTICK